jgi:serine protease inhibitor ecotin
MPKFRTARADARTRLKTAGGQGYQNREPYRQAIQDLSGDQVIELEPDEGESLRKVRVNLSRAAKEVGREVRSGETQEGTLLVWLAQSAAKRRGRRPKVPSNPVNLAAQATP